MGPKKCIMDNAKKLVDRIRQEEIRPTPHWIFTMKNITGWLTFILGVVMGALAFSVILLAIQQTDFSMVSHLTHSWLELFLGLLPVIWLILVLVFLIMAMFSIRNSWKGYKFSLLRIMSICILMSVALGSLFFITGGSQRLENAFDLNVFNYESIEERKLQVWNRPDEGFLSGKIIDMDGQILHLEDFTGKRWQVFYPEAFIAPVLLLEAGESIKIIGDKQTANQFKAEEIRPWGGPGNRPGGRRLNQQGDGR